MLSFVPINYHRCWPRSWKRCLRHVIEAVLGSLSKDVFERCTSTGSEALSFFICLDANKFVLIIFFSLIKTIYPRFWTKPLPIDGKSQFPVDVRLSKTLLRKLPINLPNSLCFPYQVLHGSHSRDGCQGWYGLSYGTHGTLFFGRNRSEPRGERAVMWGGGTSRVVVRLIILAFVLTTPIAWSSIYC